MKEWKISTMPVVKQKDFAPKGELMDIFDELIAILKPYQRQFKERNRTKVNYELWTTHHFRTKTFNPKTIEGVLFVGIKVLKNHVGLYFYPLHVDPALAQQLSPTLGQLRIGKTAFKVKSLTPSLKTDLQNMLNAGLKHYRDKGWIK
jgi:hypothetical protein